MIKSVVGSFAVRKLSDSETLNKCRLNKCRLVLLNLFYKTKEGACEKRE